jgi:excisionase family DNA binding protein
VVAADPGSGKLLLTITEAAERLSVGRSTIYELINRGDLPAAHIGRSARISVTALEEFAHAKRQACHKRAVDISALDSYHAVGVKSGGGD